MQKKGLSVAKERKGFFEFLQENPKEENLFIGYLWLVIIVSIIQMILLFPIAFKKNEKKEPPKPVLAVILVDTMIVYDGGGSKYLSGYRIECHDTDISNIASTPDINADLSSNSYLKFVYTISNYTKNEMLYDVNVIPDYEVKNISITYSLNGSAEKEFSKEYISGQIQPSTNFVIELYVKIANSSFDADLTGKFSLGITYFADSEEF
jgi:hypothetical protein